MKPENPQEKKTLAYKRDRVGTNSSGRYRGTWKKKETLEQRRIRRVNRTTLRSDGLRETDQLTETEFHLEQRKTLKNWGSIPLGKHVDSLGLRRISFLGRNFFKSPYHEAIHKVRFTRFLEGMISDRNKFELDIKIFFRKAMEPITRTGKYLNPDVGDFNLHDRSRWLKAYFRDMPEMEQRVRVWIDSAS